MRILLIAYDFPPTQSPRALRWRYLVRELALLGNDVHVLIPDLGEPGIEFPRMPGRVTIHRTFPGPYGWLVRTANGKRLGNASNGAEPPVPAAARLNWRGRIVDACKRLAGLVLFPDIRAEWGPWARRALRRLLADIRPEVVITSHEPASTLPLGILAKQSGFIWVADLGDPVCAAYTPRRWFKRAMTLEARVTALADTVLVTNEATRSLLIDRHGQQPHQCVVLPNGYDDRRTKQAHLAAGVPDFDDDRLELVYAGRLYGYRDPTPLLQAVAASPGVRLTLVVPDPPPGAAGDVMTGAAGDRLRVLGPMPHAQVQAMLERADVLVNFGDHGQPVRIAAKVYEYLGIARPILHVHAGASDAAAALLRDRNRGWLCGEDPHELTALLAELRSRQQGGLLHDGLVLAPVADYAHSSLGVRLAAVLEAAAGAKDSTQRQPGADAPEPGAGQRGQAPEEPEEPESPPPRPHAGALQGPGAGRSTEELERALATRDAQIRQLRLDAKGRASEINILNQRVDLLDSQIRELHASSSWRITAPLRYLATTMRGMKATFRNGAGTRPAAGPAGSPATRSTALEGKDTFVLYRIIGNDLPPRHRRGQTIDNLRFILEHEPSLEGCEKRFILNRIRDPGQEREIIALLAANGFEHVRIPFDAAEYARIGFDMEILPEPGFLAGERIDSLGQAERERLFMAIYRLKNNYAMNNNGARNAALEDGRGRAKWILPWDGNCFLTREAWERIRRDIAKVPTNRYFIVPMARMQSNELLVAGGEIHKAVEEPQIIFRKDAAERFNEAFCYGRRPKVELLWRLGVRGPWDEYPDDPWDQARAPVSPEAAAVGRAGWVARLSSGMKTLEANTEQAPLHRGVARSGAILSALRHLDARIAGMEPEHLVSIHQKVLAQEVEDQDVPPLSDVVGALVQAAERAMENGPPDLLRAFDDSLKLALAWSFKRVDRYAERASDILERSFLHSDTRTAAHAIADDPERMECLHHYLDAVRMLEGEGWVTESARASLRGWLEERQRWLSASAQGVAQRRAADHRGTGHDLQMASIASFLDDHELVYESLVRAQARISGQFAADGSQPAEISGPDTAHRCCLNFQYWLNLAELASRWGVDLWGYQAPHGPGLARGARWLLSHAGEPWPSGQAEGFDVSRLHPIRFAAMGLGEWLPDRADGPGSPYVVKPEFAPGTGIRPFWNLASYRQG